MVTFLVSLLSALRTRLSSIMNISMFFFRKLISILLLFTLSFTTAQSQSVQDTILASQYYQKADSLLTAVKTDSSIVYFKKALPIYEKAKAWGKVASCYNKNSLNYHRNKNAEQLFINVKKALEICKNYLPKGHPEEATSYERKGDYYLIKSEYANTHKYYKKSLDLRLKAQPRNQKQIARSYDCIAYTYYKEANYKEAIINYKKELQIYNLYLKKDHKEVFKLYSKMGKIEYRLGNYDTALYFYTKNLQLKSNRFGENHISTADAHNSVAVMYLGKREYNEALRHANSAISIFLKNGKENYSKTGMVYHTIGSIFRGQTKYDQALINFKKSLKIHINTSGENSNLVASSYKSIGGIYSLKKELNKALQYYKKALGIEKTILGKDHYSVALSYNNIGVLYKNKNMYDKSILNYEKALNIFEQPANKKLHYVGGIYNNLAKALTEKKEYDQALDYLIIAERISITSLGENAPVLADIYGSSAIALIKKNKVNEALLYFNKSLTISKHPSNAANVIDIIETSHDIGEAYFTIKEYKNALHYFKKALKANFKSTNKETSQTNFNPNDFFDLNILLHSLNGEAKSFKELYFLNDSTKYLNNSIASYRKADIVINHIQQSIQRHEDKIDFAKKTKETYASAIQTQLLHSNISNLKKNNQAFYYSEKSKSNTLKDLLNDANAKDFSGLSGDLVELEKDLRIDKSFYQSKVNEEFSKKESDTMKVAGYESKLFDISRRQDSLTKVLEKNYPKYHQLKYNNEVIAVTDIQQKLDEKTTLLEFFTTDSITYAFTISKNSIAVKELATPKLVEQVERFRASITKNYEEYKDISYLLYQKLIAPIQDQFLGNQLIIVPDGPLWHINFDLLHTQEDASNNPKTWPYLLKQYAISYANSATLLFSKDTYKESSSNELQECLAFSFSSGDNISTTRNISMKAFRSSSMDLPGTREEIKAIANIVDGQYFYGSEATEQNFKKHAGDYNILHLAVHGSVDNERPENSKLYFTKSKDTPEDNFLYSHELFALDIPAELTVLSACNTGTGKIAKGEGIMSLGNAFQYAGTKSLLLTNWEVSDETTPKIMEYFYTHLRKGKNKAEALQQAKLQFLTTTNQETYHPYYWGGFYLLGDTTPIQFQDNNYIYWMIGFSVLAIILLSLFWYRRQRSPLETSIEVSRSRG